MRRTLLAAGLLLVASVPETAQAGPYGDELGRCAIGATTPADRTALLRWSFLVATSNPALADLSSASPEIRQRSVRAVADIFNRIMLRDCRRQAVEALRREGQMGIQAGFQALGLMAGREMMMSEGGTASLDELVGLLDQAGLEALAVEAGAQPPI